MSNTEVTPIMQRVRHEFRARHVQLLAREQISPGFIRLTLGGPELEGFVSAGFDDHTKLILPQAGLDKPNLPQMVDGRPHIDGERRTHRCACSVTSTIWPGCKADCGPPSGRASTR